jgi:Protein of unknown function (DUF2934)
MASKAKTIGSTDPTGTAVEEGERLLHSTREQDIRHRAYEIYLQRGSLAMRVEGEPHGAYRHV